MQRVGRRAAGFTLIELMIVIAIVGVLSATAMPTFTTYIRRSRTSDAYSTLDAMFKAVSVYYIRDHMESSDIASTPLAHCTVDESDSFPGAPSDVKQAFVSTPPFSETIGISFPPGFSYYKFTNVGGIADCGRAPGIVLYSLTATGDLDADGILSTFALTTATNDSNEIYKAGNIFIQNELE